MITVWCWTKNDFGRPILTVKFAAFELLPQWMHRTLDVIRAASQSPSRFASESFNEAPNYILHIKFHLKWICFGLCCVKGSDFQIVLTRQRASPVKSPILFLNPRLVVWYDNALSNLNCKFLDCDAHQIEHRVHQFLSQPLTVTLKGGASSWRPMLFLHVLT